MDGSDDQVRERATRTRWLLAGGAASLLLPLLGVVYLHFSGEGGAAAPSGRADLFERREGAERKIVPSQAVIPAPSLVMPPPQAAPGASQARAAGSSLDFIRPSSELAAKTAETPKAEATPAPAVSTTPAPTAAKTKSAKNAKKPFTMPKLQPSRGFTGMGGPGKDAQSGQNPQDLMKNLPPGAADDPRVQEYLKSRGQ